MTKSYNCENYFVTMHIHIATVGQAAEPVIKAFNAIPGIDRAYLLCSEAFMETALHLQEFFAVATVPAEIRRVGGFDFQSIVDAIYMVYESEGGRDVEFSINITGGTNLMAAAACSCAFFVGARICYVLRDPQRTAAEQLVWIPVPNAPNLGRIKGKTRDILGYVLERTRAGESMATSDVNRRFNVDKQNSSYHLRILEDEGLIERVQDPDDKRVKTIMMTSQGRLVASWLCHDGPSRASGRRPSRADDSRSRFGARRNRRVPHPRFWVSGVRADGVRRRPFPEGAAVAFGGRAARTGAPPSVAEDADLHGAQDGGDERVLPCVHPAAGPVVRLHDKSVVNQNSDVVSRLLLVYSEVFGDV